MYKNKNKNKGVKIGLIAAFFAVIMGCLVAFVSTNFGMPKTVEGSDADYISAPDKDASTAIADGEASDGGEISAPEVSATATATTVNSGTTASAMATAWTTAINASSLTDQVTFVLQANWTAPSDGTYTTAFGTGTGFYDGLIDVPANKNIKIDLNGHIINRNKPHVMWGGVLRVSANGKLEICDNSAAANGGITGAEGGTGGAINIQNNGTLTLTNGNIYDNFINGNGGAIMNSGTFIMNGGMIIDNMSDGGGGVNTAGTFTMNGGVISNNKTGSGSNGGGVCVADGTFNMYGGSIQQNTSACNGGGVYLNKGTFNMYDGKITKNVAKSPDDDDGNGGGVFVNSGSFNMRGGEISSNDATSNSEGNGGGIYVKGGTVTIEAGNIINNSIDYDGAAICAYGGTVNFIGGTISGNNSSEGAIVYLCSTVNFRMSGGVISGNTGGSIIAWANNSYTATFDMSGGEVRGNTSTTNAPLYLTGTGNKFILSGGSIIANKCISGDIGGVDYVSGTFQLSGSARIMGNDGVKYTTNGNNLRIANGKTITITGSLVGAYISMKMSATTGTFTTGYSTYNSSYAPSLFFKTVDGYQITKTGNEASVASGTTSGSYLSWRYGTNLTSPGSYESSSSSTTYTYTGKAIQVGAYTSYSGTTTATINSRVYKDANGNSISTSSSILNAGTYSFLVNSTSYTNPSFSLMIVPEEIENTLVTVGPATYTGSAVTPTISISLNGTTVASSNYTCTYVNNVNAGTATVIIMGKNNLKGTVTKTFTINPKDISTATTTLGTTSYTYNGSAKQPTVTVSGATVDVDYTVSYSNNTNAGTAYAVITGKGNYTGSVTKTFTITPVSLTSSNTTITLGGGTQTYDGTAKTPTVSSVKYNTSTTVPTSSYSIAYSNNVNASTSAKVTLTFSGNYSGTVDKTFTIEKASLTSASVTFVVTNYTYTGAQIKAVPTVKIGTKTLAQDVDYALTYANNTNAGTATVTVTGDGNYKDTATGTFTIDRRQVYLTGIKVADKEYDGTKAATIDKTGAKLIGIVDADKGDKTRLDFAFEAGTEFDGKAIGLHKVNVTGIKLTGSSAGNYILEADEVAAYAQIYPATIKITGVVANDKTYDGTTGATFKLDDVKFALVNAEEGATLPTAVAAELAAILANNNLKVNGAFDSKDVALDADKKVINVSVIINGYTLSGAYAGNYVIDLDESDDEVSAKINRAQVNVTLGKEEYSITYGNALKITYSQSSAIKSESIDLKLEYYEDENFNTKLSGAPTDAGTYYVKVIVDPDDPNAGNYIVAAPTAENGVISEATIEIKQASLTIKVEDLSIVYGSDKPEDDDYTLVYSGWLNGDAAAFADGTLTFLEDKELKIDTDYDPEDEDNKTNRNAGTYDITLSNAELKNYKITFEKGTLTVTPKKVTVTIDDVKKAYGTEFKAEFLTSDAEDVVVYEDDDLDVKLTKADGTKVGKYAITGTYDNDNYDVTFVNGEYEITKAKLTVTAKPNTITYGDKASSYNKDGDAGVVYKGFVGEEDEDVLGGTLAFRYTYTQFGDIYEADGTTKINYYIIPYGLTAENYEIEYVNGLLTVDKKEATVTVSNASSDITNVIADRAEAAEKIKYTVAGTVNGDDLIVTLTIAETGTRNDGEATYSVTWCAVGSYDITGKAANSNYKVTFVYGDDETATHGTYTIAQGTLVITANTLIISYGDEIKFSTDIDEAVTAEGLPVGSTLKDLIDSGVISATNFGVDEDEEKTTYTVGGAIYDANGNRISYIVTPKGLTSSSYNIEFKPGKLMIEPKSIIVTLENKESTYGEKDVELTAKTNVDLYGYDDAKLADESLTVVKFLGITDLKREEGKNAGSYAITAGDYTNKNYRITFVNGIYTVKPYAVTIVWVSGDDNAVAGEDGKIKYTYNGESRAPIATFTMPNPDDEENPLVFKSTDEETSRMIEVMGSGLNVGDYKAQAFLLNNNLTFSSETSTTQTFKIEPKQLKVTWYATNKDKENATNPINAKTTKETPIEYSYKSSYPYAPVVALDGIVDEDNVPGFYYVSGEQSAVSIKPYEAVLHILNANYSIASDDVKVYFTITISAPNGFKWYKDTTIAEDNEISSLTEYTFSNGIQHPVAHAQGNVKFIYTYYKQDGENWTEVYETIHVGNYKIVATPVDANLELSEEKATFYYNIIAKVVEIDWTNIQTEFVYNGSVQVPAVVCEGLDGQMLALTVVADNSKDADDYEISVTLVSGDYTFQVEDGDGVKTNVKTVTHKYTITAKEIEITWNSEYKDDNWSMVYDSATHNTAVTALAEMVNAVENENLNSMLKLTVLYQATENAEPVEVKTVNEEGIKDAGIYTLRVELADKDNVNYKVANAEQTFTIKKKELTITAASQNVQAGSTVPSLKANFSEFAGSETAKGLGLLDEDDGFKYLSTNYNLNSQYIDENEYTKDEDIEKLETVADIAENNYKGYFIALTDSEASLAELKSLLKNYDVTFVYNRLIIIAQNGTVSIVLTQSYDGEEHTPTAMYKVGNTWLDLDVKVYKDEERKTPADSVKDVGEYYLVISKSQPDSVTLEGSDDDGIVRKVYSIVPREIEVIITDKSVVYGELAEGDVDAFLEGLWEYASKDALRRPLADDEEAMGIKLNAADLNVEGGYAHVGTYALKGEWSHDETLRNNYRIVFKGSNGDDGELKVTEAKITYTAISNDGINQILETDKANGNYLLGLYNKKDGKYENFDIAGDQNASVKIFWSNIYDRSIYELTNNLPQDEKDGAWKEAPLCSVPVAADGSYYVNFKIEVANHETYYGQWTVQVIAGKAYIRIIFNDKQLTQTYGDETLSGTDLATKLYNDGYVNCFDLTEDMFRENILNGNLTAKVLADGDMTVGSYTVVFEGIEKLNPDWIISYKQDVNASDDTATNLGKYVVNQRQLTISWGTTSFVYDGEAHRPVPAIDGWTRAEGTSTVNGATVYTFTNEQLGKTVTLKVRTNGGDFTSVGGENFVIAEISDDNYVLDSFNATRAVSITGVITPVDPVDPTDPVVVEGGLPAWALAVMVVLTLAILLMILAIIIVKKKTQPVADADGFYDDVDEEDY